MKKTLFTFAASTFLALLCTTAVTAQQPAGEDTLTPVTTKHDLYPAAADAKKEIAEALKIASSDNKRVMLIFGGNWCYDCHVLDQALHEGEAGKIANANFLLVHVDIGEGNKNLDLVTKYETTLDLGVPTVVLLNGAGHVIYSSTKGEFEAARKMMKHDLVAFLNQWKPAVVIPTRSQ
jgi:thioredoxin 1